MKQITTIIGILLIVLGIITFSYRYFTYTTNEKIVEIGNLQVTEKNQNIFVISPTMSGVSIAVGIILVLIGTRRKN